MPDREKVFRNLQNARTIINDGNNKRGMYLSGKRCSACVRWIDEALLLLTRLVDPETMYEGIDGKWYPKD